MKRVARSEWRARPPKSTAAPINAQGLTVHYEGPKMGQFPHESCASKMRAIQNFHMDSRGWSDIAYSFVACPHGYLFDGRGLGRRTAANGTNTGNSSSLATCALIGAGDVVTVDLLHAIRDSIDLARSNGAGSKLWSHRDWKPTSCPGDPLAEWVRRGAPRPTAPTPTPPNPQEDPDMNPASVDLNGRDVVYVVGLDRAAWEYGRDHPDVNDKGWRKVGGVWTSGLAARVADAGRVELFGRGQGNDRTFWRMVLDAAGNIVSSGPLAGSWSSGPSLVEHGDGRVAVHGRGLDGQLWGLVVGADGNLVGAPFSLGGQIWPAQ